MIQKVINEILHVNALTFLKLTFNTPSLEVEVHINMWFDPILLLQSKFSWTSVSQTFMKGK